LAVEALTSEGGAAKSRGKRADAAAHQEESKLSAARHLGICG